MKLSPYTPPANEPLHVHHADEHLIILEKPAGLLSVPGRGPDKTDCLIARAKVTFTDAAIVHRLDMETSGLMVLARGADMQRSLSMMFEQRDVTKAYEAVVAGKVMPDEGSIDLPLMKDWPNRPLQKVDFDDGKPSKTHWHRLSCTGHTSRMRLIPHTGRTHQLRVHLNAIGHPILGDQLYGTPESQTATNRLQLHASALSFAHPVQNKMMNARSATPF